MVICLERDADLHMAQLMPLPLTAYNTDALAAKLLAFSQSGQRRHVLPRQQHIQHRLTLCSLVSVDTCCLTSAFSTDSHCAVWSASTRVASHSRSSTPSPSLVDMPAVSVRSLRTFSSGLSQVAFSDVNADELRKLGRPTECSSVCSQSVKRVTNSLHCPH